VNVDIAVHDLMGKLTAMLEREGVGTADEKADEDFLSSCDDEMGEATPGGGKSSCPSLGAGAILSFG